MQYHTVALTNNQVRPKAIVIISAHWQAGRDHVEVNTSEKTDLIYDFYNFPKHFYQVKFENRGSKEVAEKILKLLDQAGIQAHSTKRGLDHGAWVPLHVGKHTPTGFSWASCAYSRPRTAFPADANPLTVPVVQVSLYDNEDPNKHFELGKALAPLRDEAILILGSGMSVHNLREMHSMSFEHKAPYAVAFDEAVKEAVTGFTGKGRQERMAALLKRPDARKAHPGFDHLLPIYVAGGAAEHDQAEQVFTRVESSLAWGQYRFGEMPTE